MYIISVADWERFDGSNDPEYQWNTGGFDAAVIDTKQPGSEWVLSGQLHSADYKEMGTPHIVNGLVYVFISHSDFQGFVTDKVKRSDPWTLQDCRFACPGNRTNYHC